jgi:hypothetical protein
MLNRGFDTDITNESVSIKVDSANTPLDEKAGFSILTAGVAIVLFSAMVFLPGKHDSPSAWTNFTQYPATDSRHESALILMIALGALALALLLFALRNLFPTGEGLSCDCGTFTLCKIPWFTLRGNWRTKTFPIGSISNFRYAITANGKGTSFYGFRFSAGGHKQKLFVGLGAPEADEILKALKALSVDVNMDGMPELIEDERNKREADPYR